MAAFKFNFDFNTQYCLDSRDDCSDQAVHDKSDQKSRGDEKMQNFDREDISDSKIVEPEDDCRHHEVALDPKIIEELSAHDSQICLQLNVGDPVSSNLWYINSKSVDRLLKNGAESQVMSALADLMEHSDLSSGIYEGGFKIWECSVDLTEYMISKRIDVKDIDVLELGCGGGLPAIYCLLNGAGSVCFQDFNKEVIDCFTIPNAIINVKKSLSATMVDSNILETVNGKAQFLSGGWKAVHYFLEKRGKKFDLILSSETIYNKNTYPVFHDMICSCMSKKGYALLANKTYYFGVGGSSKDFLEYVGTQEQLVCENVHQITDGVNREILKLSWK